MAVKHTSSASDGSVALTFFNNVEADTVETIAEHIIPDGGDGAGATNAGVVYYIDRSISGVSAHLQRVYRTGLRALHRHCIARHGVAYTDLVPEDQVAIIRRFLGPETADDGPTPQIFGEEQSEQADSDQSILLRLFAVIREHTIEGFFCDPVYGGNRDAVGWKLVGFPGAHWGYTAKQMGPGFDGRSLPIMTLSDLRSQLKSGTLPDNSTFTRNQEN